MSEAVEAPQQTPQAAEDFPSAPMSGMPKEIMACNSVCPCGGIHDFEPVRGDTDFWAGICAGAGSCCLFCIWWPLLICAPVCFLGGREMSRDMSDRRCSKCELLLDRNGFVKGAPVRIPDLNPVTGQPNKLYGWAPSSSNPYKTD